MCVVCTDAAVFTVDDDNKIQRMHEPGWGERLFLLGRRCYFSMGYRILYTAVLLLSVILIIWMLAANGKPEPLSVFISLEMMVTGALVGEVVFTFCSMQTRPGMWFWFDAMVAVLCVAFLAMYVTHEGEDDEELVELSIAFTVLRYAIQLLRVSVMLRQMSHKNQLLPGGNEVQMELEVWDSTISDDEPSFSPSSRSVTPSFVSADDTRLTRV